MKIKLSYIILIIIILFVLFVIYKFNKIPDSFGFTSSFSALGTTDELYEKRAGKYFHKTTTKALGKETIVNEVEITKQAYIDAYKQFFG